MMKFSLIVAMDKNYGIGKNNDLMWHLPRDMKFFKSTTEGQVVIMGRKNYDSIPEKYRPLSNRQNVIITRNKSFKAPNCLVFHTVDEALSHFVNDEREVFIIGGGEIYKIAINIEGLEKMYITNVDGVFNADTFFPNFDKALWNQEKIMSQELDEKHKFPFNTFLYTRISDK